MPKTLRERLDELDPDELRHVADFWAVSLEERPTDQWAKALHEALPTELSARHLIEQLDEKTGSALEWLVSQKNATAETLHRYVERAVGPTALLLQAGVSEEQISTALRKAGFFPRVTR